MRILFLLCMACHRNNIPFPMYHRLLNIQIHNSVHCWLLHQVESRQVVATFNTALSACLVVEYCGGEEEGGRHSRHSKLILVNCRGISIFYFTSYFK